MEFVSDAALFALFQVIMIDIMLAGDNALVIGMVAARVAPENRAKIILWGLGAAVLMRIGFAVITIQLLAIIGLLLAGGILLLWVAWRLYRDIRQAEQEKAGVEAVTAATDHVDTATDHVPATGVAAVPFRRAIFQVAMADLSMSLDNVLAVAGAAREHVWVLVVGLAFSIVLMGVAASFIARLLQRYHWLSYLGLVLIIYVALMMIWHGSGDIPQLMNAINGA